MVQRRAVLAASAALLAAPTGVLAWPYMPHLMRRSRVEVPSAVGVEEAAHLLRRVGFGYNERDAKQIVGLPLASAVQKLLSLPDEEQLPLPAWASEPAAKRRVRFERVPSHMRADALDGEMQDARRWWYATMMATSNPVRERMTLFWHGHFTSGARKVQSAPFMLRQNRTWRRHAMGNFGDFASEVVTDPAMLVFLDALGSNSRSPNYVLASVLMDRFLLGGVFYSEKDVREAARALTGMTLRGADDTFQFVPALHDAGRKTIFGKSGDFDYRSVVRLLLENDLCAEHIARKLAREVVGPQVGEDAVQEYASAFRGGKYEIRELLRAILLSSEFWHPDHRGAILKAPAVLTVELARGFGLPKDSAALLAQGAAEMGQELLDPPSVQGWTFSGSWIDAPAAEARRAFVARAMAASSVMYPAVVLEPAQMQALAQKYLPFPLDVSRMSGSSYAQFLQQLFESKEFQFA